MWLVAVGPGRKRLRLLIVCHWPPFLRRSGRSQERGYGISDAADNIDRCSEESERGSPEGKREVGILSGTISGTATRCIVAKLLISVASSMQHHNTGLLAVAFSVKKRQSIPILSYVSPGKEHRIYVTPFKGTLLVLRGNLAFLTGNDFVVHRTDPFPRQFLLRLAIDRRGPRISCGNTSYKSRTYRRRKSLCRSRCNLSRLLHQRRQHRHQRYQRYQ